MTIKKTFFTGALFLLLLAPSVSHASVLSDFEGWLGGILLGGSLDQTAAVEAAVPPATSWIDIKANKSDGPILITDGSIVSVAWTAREVASTKDCRISYPGVSGQTSKNVLANGSEKIVMFPSKSTLNVIAFTCKKDGQDVLDIVRLTNQQGGGGSEGGGTGGTGSVQGGTATLPGQFSGPLPVTGTQGDIDMASIGTAIANIFNGGVKRADNAVSNVRDTIGNIINTITGRGGQAGDKGGLGGKPGYGGTGGKPGAGGSGGKPGVTGGKPGSSGGSGGGSGGIPVVKKPADDNPPAKPKGK